MELSNVPAFLIVFLVLLGCLTLLSHIIAQWRELPFRALSSPAEYQQPTFDGQVVPRSSSSSTSRPRRAGPKKPRPRP